MITHIHNKTPLYLYYEEGFFQLSSATEEIDQFCDISCSDAVWDGIVIVLSHELVCSPMATEKSLL